MTSFVKEDVHFKDTAMRHVVILFVDKIISRPTNLNHRLSVNIRGVFCLRGEVYTWINITMGSKVDLIETPSRVDKEENFEGGVRGVGNGMD